MASFFSASALEKANERAEADAQPDWSRRFLQFSRSQGVCHRLTPSVQVALREWVYLHHLVQAGPSQCGQH